MLKRFLTLLAVVLLTGQFLHAQVTTSSMGGFVKAAGGDALVGATITATHIPTGTVYRTQTKTGGQFVLNNMNPGGPYTVTVSYVNFQNAVKEDIFLTLGESSKQDFDLSTNVRELTTVTVAATRSATQGKGGTETNIGRDRMANLPTINRNLTDFLRAVPQAKLTNTEGAISIAGQNNRYNAFYIDGAINNDVFGVAGSGTNGGQANVTPIALDAIDQIQVTISPYDPSLGGFTGGGINAITRSGTNTIQGSAYYFYRNENLAGKTPTGPKELATRLPDFKNQTYGLRVGGPIIKNKLFYFFNAEIQRDIRPQVFEISRYTGNASETALNALADSLRTLQKFGNYDPGGFINSPEKVEAERIVGKLDWNISAKHKVSLSYRYNNGERFNTSASNSGQINFYNNGHVFPSTTHSASAELRSNFTRGMSNRLLLTYVDVIDDRAPLGNPYPRVTINDGSGRIVFGTDNSSTVNLLTQKNIALFDAFKFSVGKHNLSVGTDNELNNIYNAFIQNAFGNYTYSSLDSFYANAKPTAYQAGFSLLDKTNESTNAAAKFKTARIAFFASDEFRPNNNLTLNFGIRFDDLIFITKPATDPFFNDSAIAKFSQYYNLEGARSGQRPSIPISVSPRFGFTYKMPEENITLRGGLGIFTGRVPIVWPANIYNSNGIFQGSFTANASALDIIRFRSDPFNQYKASDVGMGISKGGLNLLSAEYKLPKVFRTSLGVDKQLGRNWTLTVEGLYTKNLVENDFVNINLMPPTGVSKGPGSRTVYTSATTLVPIRANGTNPYDNAILLRNAKGRKGYSYNFTVSIDKRFTNGFSLNANYNYGQSFVRHEALNSTANSNWGNTETVNGRNFVTLNISDFSTGHRIFAFASKKFEYLNKKLATTLTLVYNGSSGQPFSYIMGSQMVRDQTGSSTNDLVYVPTTTDLANMTFSTTYTVGGVSYTAQQQKDAFDQFIRNNNYLNSMRGKFSERNGDRLPFQNLLDFKIAQDFNIKIQGKNIQFQVTYDIFNFTNFLNRDWGRTYFLNFDQFRLLEFASYSSDLTPTYRFNPTLKQPQSENSLSGSNAAPQYNPRWTSQLGLRVNF